MLGCAAREESYEWEGCVSGRIERQSPKGSNAEFCIFAFSVLFSLLHFSSLQSRRPAPLVISAPISGSVLLAEWSIVGDSNSVASVEMDMHWNIFQRCVILWGSSWGRLHRKVEEVGNSLSTEAKFSCQQRSRRGPEADPGGSETQTFIATSAMMPDSIRIWLFILKPLESRSWGRVRRKRV